MAKQHLPSCKQRPLAFPIYISVLYSPVPHISSYNALTMIFLSFFSAYRRMKILREALQRKDTNRGAGPQRTYTYRVQSSVWRLPNYWPPTPSPPSECVLPPVPKPVGTHSPGGEGVGGSIFQKTPDIGLSSYSIIPLRFLSVLIIVRYCGEWLAIYERPFCVLFGDKYISHEIFVVLHLKKKDWWTHSV